MTIIGDAPDADAGGAVRIHAGAPSRNFWLGLTFGLLTSLIWGVQPLVTKLSIEAGLNAVDVTVLRFVGAGLALLPVALGAGRFPVGALGWPRALALSALAGVPFSLAIIGGVAFAPPLHSAVVSPGLIPVCAMTLAFVLLGARPSRGELASLGLIVLGLILFSWQAITAAPLRADALVGDGLFALSAVMWASFGFLAKRWQAHSLSTTASIALLSLLVSPLLALAAPVHLLRANLSAMLLQALFQGVLVGVVALYLYTRTVALLGAVQAAFFLPLVPIVTAAVDITWFGESPSVLETLGMAVVVLGMMLSILSSRSARERAHHSADRSDGAIDRRHPASKQ